MEPRVADYYVDRGELYWSLGGVTNVSAVLADFTEAIRLQPKNADVRISRGATHYTLGQINQAVSDFDAALRLSPDCVLRHFRRAETFRGRYGRWRTNGERYKAVVPYFTLVECDKRRLERALADFRVLVRSKDEIGDSCVHWLSWWVTGVVRGKGNLPGAVFVSDMPWVRSTCGYGAPVAFRHPQSGGPAALGPLPYSKAIRTHAFADGQPAEVVVDASGQRFSAFKAQVGSFDLANESVQYQVVVDGKVRHETPVLSRGGFRSISVDVAGAKEIKLNVLNGGDGDRGDSAVWGSARFVRTGAEDPLEVPPAELQSATDADAALLLAEVWWRLNEKERARRWYDKAAAWMDKHPAEGEKLRGYRAEAAELLGMNRHEKQPPAEKEKKKAP